MTKTEQKKIRIAIARAVAATQHAMELLEKHSFSADGKSLKKSLDEIEMDLLDAEMEAEEGTL